MVPRNALHLAAAALLLSLGSVSPSRAAEAPKTSALGASSHLLLQQWANEGYYADNLDLEDADAVFGHVWAKLPDQVIIYPSENYFYFILYVKGRQVWGNIRLPAGRRERGVLSFGYSEFDEFPSVPGGGSGVSRAKYFMDGDGLTMKALDPFHWQVSYNRKTVAFKLHELRTDPPKSFNLRTNETFLERTFDESGMQFFLLFNTERNCFFWVLNEEEKVPDTLESLDKDILVGRRTGFAFWVDGEKPPRKVLATIRKLSVNRNDYYDGPFDQLADNYVEVNQISKWMERAIPSIKGRIDKYGYYTDSERPSRVALSCYGTYYTQAEIIEFVKKAKAAPDAYQFISRGGVPLPDASAYAGAGGTNQWWATNAAGKLTNAVGPILKSLKVPVTTNTSAVTR